MQLVACSNCRAQYDVSDYDWQRFACECGQLVEVSSDQGARAINIEVHNCSACGAPMEAGAKACVYCRAAVEYNKRKLTLICPECYARNNEGSRFCRGCGITFDARPLQTQPTGLHCPVCDIEMRRRTVAGHPADECPRCEGLWIGRDYFTAMVNRSIEALRNRLGENYVGEGSPTKAPRQALDGVVAYRKCPLCKQVMHRKNFKRVSGVIIDECGDHGIWLDADELEHIAGFVAGGGLQHTAEFDRRHGLDKVSQQKTEVRMTYMYTASNSTELKSNMVELVGNTLVDVLEALFRRF